MSKQAINEYVRIAEELGDLLGEVQGTALDTKPQLKALAAMPCEARRSWLLDTVQTRPKPERAPAQPKPPSERAKAILRAFNSLPRDIQIEIWGCIRTMFEDVAA